jgi:hypothetical protein
VGDSGSVTEASHGDRSARTRPRVAVAVGVFVLAWLWLSLRPSAPLHEDTSRDLAFARDLVEGTQLHTHGAWASFVSLHQGTSWIDFLALCQLAGAGTAAIEAILGALLAAVVGLGYLGFSRALPEGEDPLVHEIAALVGALVVLAALPMTCELPILWQPILLPLPVMLAHLALWRLLRGGALVDALALAVFCALALDIHVVSVALVLPAIAAVFLASERPLIAAPLAAIAGVGTLALSSWGAVVANLEILVELGWLIPSLVAVALAGVLGGALRRRFLALGWEARLRAALGAELSVLAVIVATSLLPATPSLSGRYLLPFVPAVGLAAALAASWARSRRSAAVSLALALGLVLASLGSLRPRSERRLPIYPQWRVAEFDAIAAELDARELTWTELAARLQGPSHAQILGHLSAFLAPGEAEPGRADEGLLILGLAPADGEAVLAELGEDRERATRLELDEDLHALILPTPARADRLGARLCRDGQDCEPVVIAVTSRVYQAHTNAWIGDEPARGWLEDEGRVPREIQWRVPVRRGPRAVLMLSSTLPEHCAWFFVAAEGFEASASLPSRVVELPDTAEGALLVARELDEDWACREHGVFPPAIIELRPEWTRLRELLAPPQQ